MRSLLRRLKTFSGILWLCSILVAAAIAFAPLAENVWAYYMWIPTPCHGVPARYFFQSQGKSFYCGRVNFWDRYGRSRRALEGGHDENPGTCYMNGGDPPYAVYALDAHHHLEQGADRFATAGLLLAACAVITTAARQRARRAANAPRP